MEIGSNQSTKIGASQKIEIATGQTLDTGSETVADSVVGGVKRTLMLLEQRVLKIPDDGVVLTFVMSNGQLAKKPVINEPAKEEVKKE